MRGIRRQARSRRRHHGWTLKLTLLAVAVTAIASIHACPARADDDSAEEDLIKRGVEDRRHQDDAAALELFRQAYAIHQGARAEAQMGLAEVALGRWSDAEQHIGHALKGSDPWIRKNSAVLQTTLAKARKNLGDLQVMGSPAGAEVVIEGEPRGTLPMAHPVRVRVGECRFDVRAPGFAPLSRTVEIAAGALTRETVRLSQLSVAVPPPVAAEPAMAAPPRVIALSQAAPGDATDGDQGRPNQRIVGILMGGMGVAAAGMGLTFGLLARAAGEHDRSLDVYDPTRESVGKNEQTWQYIGYGIGAVLLAGGITTYVMGGPKRHSEHAASTAQAVSLSPAVSPTANGALAGISGRL